MGLTCIMHGSPGRAGVNTALLNVTNHFQHPEKANKIAPRKEREPGYLHDMSEGWERKAGTG